MCKEVIQKFKNIIILEEKMEVVKVETYLGLGLLTMVSANNGVSDLVKKAKWGTTKIFQDNK